MSQNQSAIMVSAARQPDSTQFFAAAKPALAEFQSLPASGDIAHAAERVQPEKESDKVRQQFPQWRQKANPSEAVQ
jgi:hypothetical protein